MSRPGGGARGPRRSGRLGASSRDALAGQHRDLLGAAAARSPKTGAFWLWSRCRLKVTSRAMRSSSTSSCWCSSEARSAPSPMGGPCSNKGGSSFWARPPAPRRDHRGGTGVTRRRCSGTGPPLRPRATARNDQPTRQRCLAARAIPIESLRWLERRRNSSAPLGSGSQSSAAAHARWTVEMCMRSSDTLATVSSEGGGPSGKGRRLTA